MSTKKPKVQSKNSRLVRVASGFRIGFIANEHQSEAWGDLMATLSDEPYTTLAECLLDEPFYVDDYLKSVPPAVLLYNAMQSGELFACFYGAKLAALATLTGIIREREAMLEAWVMPDFRGHFCIYSFYKKLVTYAFSPLVIEEASDDLANSGLGLRKLKATVAAANAQAVMVTTKLSFFQVGRSPNDGLFSGKLTDMLLLELPNPQYHAWKVPENEIRKQQSTPAANVSTASPVRKPRAVRKRARLSNADTAGHEPDGHNGAGGSGGVDATPVATTPKRPNEPRRSRSVRK